MNKYISFFRMRFLAGLQYRAAALAGIATQFAWGALLILMYKAFYEADAGAFPMSFQALSSYMWMQQAFLALYATWVFENDIFSLIMDGGIAYELCRPINLYTMWFARSMANRLSRALLRCLPILIVAGRLPEPYGMSLPVGGYAAFWFAITMIGSSLVVVAFCMIVYIITFFTLSPTGVKLAAVSMVEFLSGAVIPLPFLPDNIRLVIELLPFASMQNVPLRIYSGDIAGNEIYYRFGLQVFWLLVMMILGQRLLRKALRNVVVQGG